MEEQESESKEDSRRGGRGGGAGRLICLAEESEEVQEEREEVEENEDERDEKSEDFLSGTGGFGLPSPRDLVLGREDATGERGKEVKQEEEKGEVGGREKAPGLVVRGEDGMRGEDTGVPGVGVLD